MAFYGSHFIFDGVPCETFDLMIYNIGKDEQGEMEFANTVSVVEASMENRWRPLFYGTKFEKKLTFDMVFGVNQQRIDNHRYLDRYELEGIASWLAGHDGYRWLEMRDEDLADIRFNCVITELSVINHDDCPYALKATVTCDSPYAYTYPYIYSYDIDGESLVTFDNISSHNGYFFPQLEITVTAGNEFSITNLSDNNRCFKMSRLDGINECMYIDCDTGVISNTSNTNLYDHFNFVFLRLKRGINELRITGSGRLVIKCVYPVAAGG